MLVSIQLMSPASGNEPESTAGESKDNIFKVSIQLMSPASGNDFSGANLRGANLMQTVSIQLMSPASGNIPECPAFTSGRQLFPFN